MKKLMTALTLSLTALVASNAMAGSYDHDQRWNQEHRYSQNDKYQQQNHRQWNNDQRRHQVNPSRDWHKGNTLPRQYSSSRYQVHGSQLKRLPDASRNQQWYSINGDYVLVNEKNNKIVRIIN